MNLVNLFLSYSWGMNLVNLDICILIIVRIRSFKPAYNDIDILSKHYTLISHFPEKDNQNSHYKKINKESIFVNKMVCYIFLMIRSNLL
jgi:hypothetical protein